MYCAPSCKVVRQVRRLQVRRLASMEGRPERIADYFVVVGVGNESISKFKQFSSEEEVALPADKSVPEAITDIAVFYSKYEQLPKGYRIIENTPGGHSANLSVGSIFSNGPIYICYKKEKDKLPITDIGVFHSNQNQSPPAGHETLAFSIGGRSADLNKSYLTIKRGLIQGHNNAITDLCVVASNKGEEPPACFKLLRSLDLSKGLVGNTLHLCYRTCQVRPPSVAYTPELLSRYPPKDHLEFPLPHSVPLFCLPFGVSIEHWERHAPFPFPSFSTFALTNAQGQCMYGAVVVFYEAVGDHKCREEMRRELNIPEEEPMHMNKCICLLSHWPFFSSFKAFLSALYRLSISRNIPLPLERYIGNLMLEVPFPTLVRPRIQMHIGGESIVFSLPVQTPLPLSVSTHWSLLSSLDSKNCLTLLSLTLLEQKIVLHSSRPALLTCVGEALRSILFPFSWQCTYIPLCPLAFSSYMQAPVPFIIGIDSQFFDVFEKPAGVVVVDLDANSIIMSKEVQELVSKHPLPAKPAKVLKNTLKQLIPRVHGLDYGLDLAVEVTPIDYNHTYKFDLEAVDIEIREAFLRFFASIIGHYRKCLIPLLSAPSERSCDASHLFDQKLFLKHCPSLEWPFFRLFFDTQIFNAFVEQLSFAHTENTSLVFFDECTEKVKHHPDSKLVNARASISRRSDLPTVVSLLPDDALPKKNTYSYPVFPTNLNPVLFDPPHPQLPNKTTQPSSSHAPFPSVTSGSPLVARRTPAEKKKDQEFMERTLKCDTLWSKCLLSHVCSLWYVLLPSHLSTHWNKMGVLSQALNLLEDMRINKALPHDEVCYRILMQQCVNLKRPALAVRVYHEMIKAGIQPNAVTYGFYNKAVLEGVWPNLKRRWKVLMIVISVCLFLKKQKSSLNSCSEETFEEADFSLIARSGSLNGHKSISALDVGLDHNWGTQNSLLLTSSHRGTIFKLATGTASGGGDYVVCGDSSYVAPQSPNWGEGGGANRGLWSNAPLSRGQSSSNVRLYNGNEVLSSDSVPSLNMELSTCSQCPTCQSLLYDEQIMGGWGGDEGNYKTTCPYCSSQLVAYLTVTTKQTLPPSSSLNATPPTKPSATPPSSGSPPSPVSPGEVVETHFDDKTWPRTSPRQSLLTHNNLNSTRTSDLKVPSMFEGAPIPSEATERTEGQESEESDRITVVKQIPLHERDDISSNSSSDPLHRRNNIEITIGSSYLDDSSNPELSTEISSTHSAPILPEVKTQPSDQPPNSEIHAGLKKPTETISSNHLCANSDHVMRNNAASHVTSTDVDSQLIVKSNSGVKELRVRDRVSQDQPDLGGGFSSYIARMKVLGHRRASSAPIKNMPNSTPFVGQDLGTCGISVPCEGVVPIASRTNQLPGYKTEVLSPLVVPYLSPVVLRKEVESLISQDGSQLLEKEELVRTRPIIYWNLVWYFTRLRLPTYLPLLSLWDLQRKSNELKKHSVRMKVELNWDSQFPGVREPLYLVWLRKVLRQFELTKLEMSHQNSESQLQSLVARVQCGEWSPVISSLLKDRVTRAESAAEDELVQRSIYRETLFLNIIVSGKIDIDQFDREYMQHVQRLPKELSGKLHPQDYPPTQRSVHCRRDFGLLQIK